MQSFGPAEPRYVYGPADAPLGSVVPEERFEVIAPDCFSGRFDEPSGFTPENVAWVEENLDGVTGPILVEGVQAGQAVAVRIEAIEPLGEGCVVVSRAQAHSPLDWWDEEDRVIKLRIADGAIRLADGWSVPLRPLIGCLATSPARETILSRHEDDAYGGNLDCREIAAGAIVVLPAGRDGGGLYFGDCKAALADGEVICAPEIGARILAAAWPLDRPASMSGPRVLSEAALTTISSGISLADAARSAFRALRLWLEDEWGLSAEQTALVMGVGAHCGIGQVSNRLHTAKCSIARDLLPPGAAGGLGA